MPGLCENQSIDPKNERTSECSALSKAPALCFISSQDKALLMCDRAGVGQS